MKAPSGPDLMNGGGFSSSDFSILTLFIGLVLGSFSHPNLAKPYKADAELTTSDIVGYVALFFIWASFVPVLHTMYKYGKMKSKLQASGSKKGRKTKEGKESLAFVKDSSFIQWNFYDEDKKALDTENSKSMKSAKDLFEAKEHSGMKFTGKNPKKEIKGTEGPSYK